MTNPIFSAGDVVWHVRYGKVTLEETHIDWIPVGYRSPEGAISCVSSEGKELESDVGRVLYTLSEAAHYGWYKPEPLRMKVDAEVRPCGDGSLNGRVWVSLNELQPLVGKRVRLTIEELQE